MVSYKPDEVESVPEPEEIRGRIARKTAQLDRVDDNTVEKIKTSDKPLSIELLSLFGTPISLGSSIRTSVFSAIEDTEKVTRVSSGDRIDDSEFTIYTHPEVLQKPNRLLPLGVVAKAYQYGYLPSSQRLYEGTNCPDRTGLTTDVPHEFRVIEFLQEERRAPEELEEHEEWFDDESAVAQFTDEVVEDNVNWEKYIPWARTRTIPLYRINKVAQKTNWSDYPRQPETRPEIKDRYEIAANPRIGDFIRMAILQHLESELPSVANISTSPNPWATDRISMIVKPTPWPREAGIDTARHCSPIALHKLTKYGYRPIDAWYNTPLVGQESDDPVVSRRIDFARGKPLRDWYQTVMAQSTLFDDERVVRQKSIFEGFDWTELISCIRSRIITNKQLYNRAQERRIG